MPTPFTEISWEGWMYHEIVAGLGQKTATEENSGAGYDFFRGGIDTKAMRKIEGDETLFGCFEPVGEQGTVILEAEARTRMLIFLP